MLEFPAAAGRWPEGTQDLVRSRAEHIAFDLPLYRSIREYLNIQDALDHYMHTVLPFTPKRH